MGSYGDRPLIYRGVFSAFTCSSMADLVSKHHVSRIVALGRYSPVTVIPVIH